MARKRFNSMAAIYGLENEDVAVVENPESEVALVESENAVDETMDDIDTANDTAETLTNDAETVDNVAEIVDDSIESGEGLDETSAAVVQEAVESIYRRHGMPRRSWPKFPSLESYNGRSNRVKATMAIKVSLEGVMTTIFKAIEGAWEKIKQFFSGLWKKFFDFETRLLGKFKDLKKDVKNLKAPEKNEPFELGAVEDFRTSSETVSMKDIKSSFDKFATEVNGMKAKMNKFQEEVDDKIEADDGLENKDFREDKSYGSADEATDNEKLKGAKLTSEFSTINLPEDQTGDDKYKAKKINPSTASELEAACDSAIKLLSSRPMAQMEKYSDGLISHVLKTIKSWFTSEEKVNDAERGYKYEKPGEGDDAEKVSMRARMQQLSSAYRYIMYNNIKVYKDTISVFYDIVDDLAKEHGFNEAKED